MSNQGYQSVEVGHDLDDLNYQSHPSKDGSQGKKSPHHVDSEHLQPELAERSRWFPWLVLSFVLCVFFTVSMIYAVTVIDDYDNNRERFLLVSWLLFLVPSLVIAFFVVTPRPRAIRHFRHRISTKRPSPWYGNLLNFLNTILCLVATAIYLWVSAIPTYNTAHWEDDLEYQGRLPIPSTAFVFWGGNDGADVYPVNETVARAKYGTNYIEPCMISNGSTTQNRQTYSCSHAMEWVDLDGARAYIFNSSKLGLDSNTLNDLYSEVWLTNYINYRSSETAHPTLLDLGFPFFDPKIDLQRAWHCGLIASPTIPAFETIYASLRVTYTTDEFDLLSYASPSYSNEQACQDAARALIPDTANSATDPYRSWDWGFTGVSVPDLAQCDADGPNGENAVCASQVAMSYASQVVTKASSVPGISQIDIWVNAGGVVGGVQFFFWFFSMFISY